MSDETTTSERVGFCQDCGKSLTKETVRAVGAGAFCEPCLQTRLAGTNAAAQSAAGYSQTGAGTSAGDAAPLYAGEPHPLLAGLLGFIPGVGAMYNGQFAKGVAHIVVFAVLVSLAKHVNGVFGLFVTGWEFFMAIEAYHTARARRDGLPLPNAFGFNDIGERMGFGKSWGAVGQVRPQAPVTPPPPAATQGAPVPPAPASNWAGYVPPPAASASYAAGTGNAPYTAPVPPTPYSTPYNAGTYSAGPTPSAPFVVPTSGSSFPLVAVWLIGLGVLFTTMEWMPRWHVNSSSVVAIILGAVAASVIVRRLGYMGGLSYQGPLLHMMRGPVVLAVLAVIFLLQGVHAATFGQTWPVLLLALGAVLLGERLGMGTQSYPQAYDPQGRDPGPVSVPPASEAATTSATTTEAQHNDERDGYTR